MFEALVLLRELHQLFPADQRHYLTFQNDKLVVYVWIGKDCWETTCETDDLKLSPINLAEAIATEIRNGIKEENQSISLKNEG